jgi:hypothetical protein
VTLLAQIESGQVDTPRARLRFSTHRRGLLVTGSIDSIPVGTHTHPVTVRDAEAGEIWLRSRLRSKP